jgi:hypothetical protein
MGFAVAGVVVIISLGLAWLSFKTWRIAQVLAMFCIIIASGFFMYLAAMTLKTHKAWKEIAAVREKELEAELAQIIKLKEGAQVEADKFEKGLRQLRAEVYKVQVERGGVYYGVDLKAAPDPATGNVTVIISKPDPHGLLEKTVLFVFDENGFENGAKYLGEFKVTKVTDMSQEVELAPNMPPTPEMLQVLAANRGKWTMYLTMPIDHPTAFAHMDDAGKRAFLARLPNVDEYLKADRPLHDYEFAYHEYQLKMPQLQEDARRLAADAAKVTKATEQVNKELEYRKAEKAKLEADKAEFEKERDLVIKYRQKLEQQNVDLRNQSRAVYFENKRLAEELVAAQLKAAEEANRRTGVPLSAVKP